MLHFRNPMRSEQHERSLGTRAKTKPRRGNAAFAPRRHRGAMERPQIYPPHRNTRNCFFLFIHKFHEFHKFYYRRTAVSPVFFLFLQKIQKHRRCFTSVTPCGASNASGAWGRKGKNKTAPRERRIRSPTPSRRNGTTSNRSVLTETHGIVFFCLSTNSTNLTNFIIGGQASRLSFFVFCRKSTSIGDASLP